MPQELIQVYIELFTTLKDILIPLTVFICVFILTLILKTIITAGSKAYYEEKLQEEEIKLLREKYKNENKH